eukprot:TRINITY_DN3118_c0_g1_i1.p1 TRINITY_DN3118_c0_g1~~TRINITY_DN3118_c0_g1_i1.p1  ORF type:complete len:903 (+),score=235.28 TRINITY_DN3118_c0_g1_i1:180-2888(+)
MSQISDSPRTQNNTALMQLCARKNLDIAAILSQIPTQEGRKRDDSSAELRKTNEYVTKSINRCLNEYGDLNNNVIDVAVVDGLYYMIKKFEERLNKATQKRQLAQFLMQARLRKKIDQASNFICVKIEEIDRHIKQAVFERILNQEKIEFKELVYEVENEQTDSKESRSRSGSRKKNRSTPEWYTIKDREIQRKITDFMCIVKDPERERLLENLVGASTPVRPLLGEEIGRVVSGGGDDEFEHIIPEYVFGQTISTYPIVEKPDPNNPGQNTIENTGFPLADKYSISVYENRIIPVVCDGCGWGIPSKEAAKRASRMFASFLNRHQQRISTVREAGDWVLKALMASHRSIVFDKNTDVEVVGTTTIIGGIVLEIDQNTSSVYNMNENCPFVFVSGSIGDCKAFKISAKTRKCWEITRGNRGTQDLRDPGGRIGPDSVIGEPDLRNLRLQTTWCEEGDMIILMSDGVHDNFSPRSLGMLPSQIGLHVQNDDWSSIADDKEEITLFMENLVAETIGNTMDVAVASRNLLKYCQTTTTKLQELCGRPGKLGDYETKDYPGKLDHTTVLSFKVFHRGNPSWRRPSVSNNWNGNNTNTNSNFNPLTQSTPNLRVETPSTLSPRNRLLHSSHDLNNNMELDAVDLEPQKLLWDRLFGEDSYTIGWRSFIDTLNLNLNEEEEESFKMILDNSNTQTVTRYKFQEFLKGFGPLENVRENVNKLIAAQWFHGYISGPDAHRELQGEPPGTYLVRFSGSRPGVFVLDYARANEAPNAVRLCAIPSGGFAVGDRHFNALEDLLHFYISHQVLKAPYTFKIANQPWFFGDITGEEAEAYLSGSPPGTFLIRFSMTPGCYAASFVGPDGLPKKGLIAKTNGGFQVNGKGQLFQSIEALIDGYRFRGYFTNYLVID